MTPQRPARSARGPRSVASLVLSLAVVLGFAFTIVSITPRPKSDPVRVIDFTKEWDRAAQAAAFPVYAPVDLPERWRATSARVRGSETGTLDWHVGFVTPADLYAGVEQGDGPAPAFLDRVAPGRDEGEVSVAGQGWQRRSGDDGRTVWRAAEGSTVAVTGTAQWAELEQLAAALRPR